MKGGLKQGNDQKQSSDHKEDVKKTKPIIKLSDVTSSNNSKSGIKSDDVYKKLKEDKKKLKRELINKENEILNLKRIISDKEKETQNNFIPLMEAKKITSKALKKGSAAQRFINVLDNSSINYKLKKNAINQLLRNAFGVINYKKNKCPETLKYTDSHLKLFRQEQLILLAENERLTLQMKELKKQILDNKIDILKKNEKNYIHPMRNNKKEQENKNINQSDESYIELDADVVEKNLISLIKNIRMAQIKLLYFAFQKIKNNLYQSSEYINKSNNATVSLNYSIHSLNSIIKYKRLLIIGSSFYKLLTYNKNNYFHFNAKSPGINTIHRYIKPSFNFNNRYNEKYNEKYNSNVDINGKNQNICTSNYVIKPYYYDNLPSALYNNNKNGSIHLQGIKNEVINDILIDENNINNNFINKINKSNHKHCQLFLEKIFTNQKFLHNTNSSYNSSSNNNNSDNNNNNNNNNNNTFSDKQKVNKNSYYDLGITINNKNNNNDEEYYNDNKKNEQYSFYDELDPVDSFNHSFNSKYMSDIVTYEKPN
ncbi:conserved protein, unknown function [Hepatocystis sp. ex Piliocolobus tephrosceles]|nr:conserved protein, unknown function [Hepatocystis sp. ex Piliocolobus tephrosceles]